MTNLMMKTRAHFVSNRLSLVLLLYADIAILKISVFNEWTNGTVLLKTVNNCLNTNIYSFLETLGGNSFNLYLNVAHFFNNSVN